MWKYAERVVLKIPLLGARGGFLKKYTKAERIYSPFEELVPR
jgi:hypothetical protein